MRLISLVRPSFSHAFLNRRSICSAVSLPRDLTLIIQFDPFSFRSVGGVSMALPVNGNSDSVPAPAACSSGRSCMSHQHTITLRVRYPEADAMGYLHHSRFFQYFEMGASSCFGPLATVMRIWSSGAFSSSS